MLIEVQYVHCYIVNVSFDPNNLNFRMLWTFTWRRRIKENLQRQSI